MPYTYNDQLIESVAVRRRRLLHALALGRQRSRYTWNERLVGLLVGGFLAALISAGCVAFSFITHLIAQDPMMRTRPTVTSVTTDVTPGPTSATPGPTRTTAR